MIVRLHLRGFNAEPWTAPDLSVGRSGGRVFPRAHKKAGLAAYQNAVREAIESVIPEGWEPYEGDVRIILRIWRQLESYTSKGRKSKRKLADATNMQKAFEDAIQGLIIVNDVQVRSIETHIIAQDEDVEPCIEALVYAIDRSPYGPKPIYRDEQVNAHGVWASGFVWRRA